MKLALVHDYLNQLGGAERVVGSLHRLFPEAPIYTTIADRAMLWESLDGAEIQTSWMQHLPALDSHFKRYLPLYPFAIESLDLRAYDVVLSSSSAWAKSVVTRPGAVHLCYCHTPMRFAWDYDRYVAREQFGALARTALPPVVAWLKAWDLKTAGRPTRYIANSTVVKERILRHYGLESEVIFPPVEVDRYHPSDVDEPYFLVVSRLAPYKRIDLAVEAFNRLGLPLVVIGDGPDRPVLERLARPNVRFLGRLPDTQVAEAMARCRAFVFPGEEDFGLTPLEANASGRPVIAYRAGGALDTVREGQTGLFFDEPNVTSLMAAVSRFQAHAWDKGRLRRHAERFSEAVFGERMRRLVSEAAAHA
jgi:glycosyltransferase involved in cell wall biosynthesis